MWICPKCGKRNKDKFCSNCATAQPAPVVAVKESAKWICPKCGKKNRDKFCSSCATAKPVAAKATVSDASSWRCPKCETVSQSKHCAVCGTAKPAAVDEPMVPAKEDNKARRITVTIVAIVFVILRAIPVFVHMMGDNACVIVGTVLTLVIVAMIAHLINSYVVKYKVAAVAVCTTLAIISGCLYATGVILHHVSGWRSYIYINDLHFRADDLRHHGLDADILLIAVISVLGFWKKRK